MTCASKTIKLILFTTKICGNLRNLLFTVLFMQITVERINSMSLFIKCHIIRQENCNQKVMVFFCLQVYNLSYAKF